MLRATSADTRRFEILIQFLVDDSVLAVWVPACLFVIGYAGTIWWMAEQQKARLRTWVHIALSIGALAIHLCWMIAAWLFAYVGSVVIEFELASENPAARTVYAAGAGGDGGVAFLVGLAYLLGAVAWPLAWCLLAGAVLWLGRAALRLSTRSLLAAVVMGSLVTIVPLAVLNVAEVLALIPDWLRVVGLPLLLAVAVVVLAVSGRRSRVRVLDRTLSAAIGRGAMR